MPRVKQKSQLTFVDYDGSFDGKHKAGLFKCDCGKIIRVRADRGLNGKLKSCGCLSTKTTFVSKHIILAYWTAFVSNTKRRGKHHNVSVYLSDDITPEYLDNLLVEQNFKCALTNLDINLPNHCSDFLLSRKWTASIDRIDSNLGYQKGNIQWIHKDIQFIKSNFNEKELLYYCRLIVDNTKQR